MNEFLQIRQAVVRALQDAGLTAMPSFPPQRGGRALAPAVSVSVGALEGKSLGFCNYLGETAGPDGCVREQYGKLLEGLISVDVRAERAADCDSAAELAGGVLLSRLPQGIQPGELRWEGLVWERETGAFLRKGSLACSALFFAESNGDEDEFLDFILKGVLT